MQQDKVPILSFDKKTGFYEGTLLIQVDPEIFRRLLLKSVEEDETADLTDPTTWVAAINKVGKILNWLDKPHVTLTPISRQEVPEQPIISPAPLQAKEPEKQDTYISKEDVLREKARHIPPHLWEEQLITPLASPDDPEQKRIYTARGQERMILRRLLKEWEDGTFVLDPEAVRLEQEHRRREDSQLEVKIAEVATAVNGSRLH